MQKGARPDGRRGARPETSGLSDASGAAEADGYLARFHQHRDPAAAGGEFEHFFQGAGFLQYVFVNDVIAFLAFGLPGLLSIRSALFAEDNDFFRHFHLPKFFPDNRSGYRENQPGLE
jgi:hypothetical protein